MLGSVIKYVGLEEERYESFVGHIGYVTSYTAKAADGKAHVAVEWFEPLPTHFGRTTRGSHFALERFEILSSPPSEEKKDV
jgi:hypothetical protein